VRRQPSAAVLLCITAVQLGVEREGTAVNTVHAGVAGMAKLVCIGEALIDFVAMEPCTDVGASSGFLRAPGGAPANVAVAAAKLGCSSAFLGKVGNDPFGRFLQRTIADAGVNTEGMVLDPHHRTGLAFVSLGPGGERDFCFFRNPSADMTYTPEELCLPLIDGCSAIHFGSITLIDPAARRATIAAVDRARSAGKLVSYDPNLRPPLWNSLKDARKRIFEGMKLADLVKVSMEELNFLFNADLSVNCTDRSGLKNYAERLLKKYPNIGLLTVTFGPDGSGFFCQSGAQGIAEGFNVEAVDTTGAGDGFIGAVIAALIEAEMDGATLKSASASTLHTILRRANAVGALATTQKGAIPAMPDNAAVDAFLHQR
jgi:fructokinase